jgi:subtilisin family serine protease
MRRDRHGLCAAGRARQRVLVAALMSGALAGVAAPAGARPAAEPGLALVSSHLRVAHTLARLRTPLDQLAAADQNVRLRDSQLEVEIRFRALDPGTVEAIRALGAHVDHVSYRYARVLARVDPDALPALAALPGVTSIHPNYGAQNGAGDVPGQGDASVHADAARGSFGVDGSGVRVGILSDSFHQLIGGSVDGTGCERLLTGSTPQLTQDLPAEVVVLNDGPPRSADEGAALGQILHDVAPGAALLFASAYPDEATFAEDIDALVACGADVLVDDVLYYAEPMFQDGIIAQAAQAAVDGGVPFFSAVANHGRAGVEQVYRAAVPGADDRADPPSGNDFHDFASGHPFATVTVPVACGVRIVLQWDEPFSGTLGAGASSDLDLYLFSAADPTSAMLASSTDSQGCSMPGGGTGGDPLEIATYLNPKSIPQTLYLAVNHYCGRPDVRFRIATFAVNCTLPGNYVFEPDVFDTEQIYGHPAAAGVTGIAAAFYGEIDSGGSFTPPSGVINVEPFSARGGELPIAFDGSGQALPGGLIRRFKPDLTAPDGVNTTFFGTDIPYDDDGFPNFFGTSAAAPHVAGVAALMRQINPALAPLELVSTLRATAVDIEAPGPDELAGDGLIDAYAAVATVVAAGTPTPTASPPPTPTATATLRATITVPSVPAGDCNGDRHVSIAELIISVRIALDQAAPSACLAADRNGDGRVDIDELVAAVGAALDD